MGQILGRSCPPGVQLLPHFEVWSYRACQPLQMWQISNFCEIHSLSYEASKFFAMLSLCVFFGRYFAPGANILPPIAYKSHSTPFPIRPHVLTPHSWLCGKKLREEKRAEVWSGRIVITILECTFPEENVNGACSGKKHHPVARALLGLLLGGC